MKGLLAFTLLLLSAVVSPTLAQDVNSRSSGVGEAPDAAKAQAMASSFEQLQSILRVGQAVRVREESGRTTGGKVVSISSNQLMIGSPRAFRQAEERVFTKDVVKRIEVVDSRRNGAFIGALIGAGLAGGVYLYERKQPPATFRYTSTLLLSVAGIPASIGLGAKIDGAINDPVYERKSQTPRLTISPLLDRDRKGVLAQVQF